MARRRAIVVAELAVLLGELLALEAGQSRQAHLEDGLGLPLGEEVRRRSAGRARSRPPGGPARRTNSSRPRSGSFISVDLRDRRGRATARMVWMTRSTSVIAMPSPSTISRCASACRSSKRQRRVTTSRAVLDEDASVSLRSSTSGRPLTIDEVDDAEGRLHVGQPIELVEDDLREHVLLQLDDEAHAVAIALVAHLGDPLDALLAHELGDLRVEARLVHLVGDLGDDDLLAIASARDLLDRRAGAHDDGAASGPVRLLDAGAARR